MNIKLFLTLLDINRLPAYLSSIKFAVQNNILFLRKNINGMITLPECVELYKLSKSLHDRSVIVEIGCYGGLSTAYLLAGAKKNKAKVYSIDPFASDMKKQKKIVGKYKNKYYTKVESESLISKPSKEQVASLLKNEGFENFELLEGYSHEFVKKWKRKIDMLWIDGNHEYKYVRDDFLKWGTFLRRGGIVAFHDANNVRNESTWKWGLPGPTKVVRKYLDEPKWIDKRNVDSLVYAKKNF